MPRRKRSKQSKANVDDGIRHRIANLCQDKSRTVIRHLRLCPEHLPDALLTRHSDLLQPDADPDAKLALDYFSCEWILPMLAPRNAELSPAPLAQKLTADWNRQQ